MNQPSDLPSYPHYQILEFCHGTEVTNIEPDGIRRVRNHNPPNVHVHVLRDKSEVKQWVEDHTYGTVHNPFTIQWVQPTDLESPDFDAPEPPSEAPDDQASAQN